jgi:hypothetical protein
MDDLLLQLILVLELLYSRRLRHFIPIFLSQESSQTASRWGDGGKKHWLKAWVQRLPPVVCSAVVDVAAQALRAAGLQPSERLIKRTVQGTVDEILLLEMEWATVPDEGEHAHETEKKERELARSWTKRVLACTNDLSAYIQVKQRPLRLLCLFDLSLGVNVWQANVRDAGAFLVEGIQSIRLSHLEKILDHLCCEMENEGLSQPPGGYTSEDLKGYLLRKGMHIPERFLDSFSVDAPDLVVTYMWLGTPLRSIPRVLRRRAGCVDILVWIDVVFNDQRSPQAIARAVSAANTLYIRAISHVVIFSEAEYPAFDERGAQAAPRLCEPWDRCWCVLEMAVRDLAVRQQGKQASVMEMQEEFRQRLARRLGPPATAGERVRAMFGERDFFGGMQGRPEDVREIQATLLSSGFFTTPNSFNAHMSDKLTNFFLSNLDYIMYGEVPVSAPVLTQLPASPAIYPPPALIAPAAASLQPTATGSAHATARAVELELVRAEAARAELGRVKAEAELERVKAEAAHAAELERVRAEAATASASPQCRCRVS